MDNDKLIQKTFDALKNRNDISVSLNEIVPIVKVGVTGIDSYINDGSHIKPRKMLLSCGMFEGCEDNRIRLTALGWKVATDFSWKYRDYKESLLPKVHFSTWIALALSMMALGIQFADALDKNCDDRKIDQRIEALENKAQEL